MSGTTRREALAASLALTARANSAISFGLIGCGARGQYDAGIMARSGKARAAVLCDRFPDKIEQAKKSVPGGDGAKTYTDYRQVLADKDVDAVVIATPVYLHPEMFEASVASGKHVYCEKPAGLDVAGVQRVMRAGERASGKQVIQFGFQQRFSPEYMKARALVEAGDLGELKILMSFWILGSSPRLTPPARPPLPGIPDEERRVRLWPYWKDLSGGDIVECDCHGLDTLNWFVGAHPVRAAGQGGRRFPQFYGNVDTDHYNIIYTYPNGAEGYLLSARWTCGFRDVKEQFYGSKGILETARTYYKLHGPVAASRLTNDDILDDTSLMQKIASKREISMDAVEAFYDAIAAGTPRNMAQQAGLSTLTSILGRMAYEKKREVTWEEMMKAG